MSPTSASRMRLNLPPKSASHNVFVFPSGLQSFTAAPAPPSVSRPPELSPVLYAIAL